MNGQDEVRAIQKALEPWIRKIAADATRNCVRRKTVTVATAPNGSTMGVREPFDDAVMDVPYVSSMSGAQVGDTVTIEWVYGLSNAWVVTREGSGGGGGGVAGVSSFKGRTGAVTPLSGDYTAVMVGAVPTTRTVNGKALAADIALTAEDVGARPDTWTPTAAEVGARPDTWTPTAVEVSLSPPSGMTSTDVQGAVSELFTSVSNGKSLVASAITDKGVSTAPDATFQTMHDNILEISGGGTCSPFQVAASDTTVFVGVIVVSGICKQYQNIKGAI